MAMRSTGYKVGQEVQAKCSKCKKNPEVSLEVQPHIIIAMAGERVARTKCNTCESEHAYRAPPTASEATAKKRRAERAAATMDLMPTMASPEDYEQLTKDKDLKKTETYSIKAPLERDDVVKHPKFGVGLVTELREGNKAHVAFPDGGRLLVHSRA